MLAGTKRCATCQEAKPLDAFGRHGRGMAANCRTCKREQRGLLMAQGGEIAAELTTPQPRLGKRTGKPIGRPKGWRRFRDPLALLANEAWGNLVKRAAATGKPMTLSRQWVFDAFKSFCEANYHSLEPGNPFRPSLDRIESGRGYSPDNVRVVWVIENLARNRFTDEQLIEFCKRKLGLL